MKYIEHIKEPTCLYLTWQPPIASGLQRMRRIVAKLIRTENNDADLEYLTDTEDLKRAVEIGFEGYPAFPLTKPRYGNVLCTFVKRMPPRTRGDFHKYLDAIRIPKEAKISDFALLGYSGAKLPEDTFNLSICLRDEAAPFEFLTEVSGFRYSDGMKILADLREGDTVSLVKEPTNQHDSKAIKVLRQNVHIGYINRVITGDFCLWMDEARIKAIQIERINGQTERPRIFLFVEIV